MDELSKDRLSELLILCLQGRLPDDINIAYVGKDQVRSAGLRWRAYAVPAPYPLSNLDLQEDVDLVAVQVGGRVMLAGYGPETKTLVIGRPDKVQS